jgi:uncharacterized phage-associated protein
VPRYLTRVKPIGALLWGDGDTIDSSTCLGCNGRRKIMRYSEKKATQAAALLLQMGGGTANGYVLLKLLYLSDRKSLIEIGRTISADRMYSLPDGPVPSNAYDHIRYSGDYWGKYISGRYGHDVKLIADPGTEDLSEYECRVLKDIYSEFGKYSYGQMWAYSHTKLPEHKDPKGSSIPIDPFEILRVAGYTEDEIAQARSVASSEFLLDNPEQLPAR